MLLYGTSPPTDEPPLDERLDTIPAGAAGVGRARSTIEDTLEAWGQHHLSDRAGLCATELVNDMEGACDELELVLSRGPERILVELRCVGGMARFHDVLTSDPARARSIAVVDGLVPIWGVRPLGDGDAVWFELTP